MRLPPELELVEVEPAAPGVVTYEVRRRDGAELGELEDSGSFDE